MKWYLGFLLATAFSFGFWICIYAMMEVSGGVSFLAMEPGAFLALGAWMCGVWAGVVFCSMGGE